MQVLVAGDHKRRGAGTASSELLSGRPNETTADVGIVLAVIIAEEDLFKQMNLSVETN